MEFMVRMRCRPLTLHLRTAETCCLLASTDRETEKETKESSKATPDLNSQGGLTTAVYLRVGDPGRVRRFPS